MEIERPSREALIRYYRGQVLPHEERPVALYLAMDIDHAYTESCMQEAWEDLEGLPSTFGDAGRQQAAWEKLQARKAGMRRLPAQPMLKRWRYAAAAALLLAGALVMAYLWRTEADKPVAGHYVAALGQRQEIRLEDSSVVVLFPGSTLDIPADFNGRERNVMLNGRAFFQVAHQAAKPFAVKSGQLLTRVLGTSFEVNATDATHTVTLLTGKVGISHGSEDIAQLTPHQRMLFDTRTRGIRIERVDAAQATAWVGGELAYDLEPLGSICRDMESWFGVTITIENDHLLNKKITTSFGDEPVTDVLDLLARTAGFGYRVEGNQITIK